MIGPAILEKKFTRDTHRARLAWIWTAHLPILASRKLMRQSSTGHERRGEVTGLHISPHWSGMVCLDRRSRRRALASCGRRRSD
jgi:hypothetical protein